MSPIPREPITSSAIASAGYCPLRAILDVEFSRDHTVYRYFDVPAELSKEFPDAASVGRFFQSRIRGQYRFARLEP